MKYKTFSPELWQLIDRTLDEVLKSNPSPVAAFDADGTLWDTDLGENFFQWQIKNKVLPQLPEDPWLYYRRWKESGDPRPAYLWLAQINQGQTLSQVQDWANQAVEELQPPVFEDQRKLIEKFLCKGVQVYVVTASVKWAVEPGARLLGLSNEQVLGVETKVINGSVTSEPSGYMTYREGKAEAIFKHTSQRPFFASGNTMGDFELLKSATQLSLAVGAAVPSHELWKTESQLRDEAQKYQWKIHRFTTDQSR